MQDNAIGALPLQSRGLCRRSHCSLSRLFWQVTFNSDKEFDHAFLPFYCRLGPIGKLDRKIAQSCWMRPLGNRLPRASPLLSMYHVLARAPKMRTSPAAGAKFSSQALVNY